MLQDLASERDLKLWLFCFDWMAGLPGIVWELRAPNLSDREASGIYTCQRQYFDWVAPIKGSWVICSGPSLNSNVKGPSAPIKEWSNLDPLWTIATAPYVWIKAPLYGRTCPNEMKIISKPNSTAGSFSPYEPCSSLIMTALDWRSLCVNWKVL